MKECSRSEIDSDVAFQLNVIGDFVNACREIDSTATGGTDSVDRVLNRAIEECIAGIASVIGRSGDVIYIAADGGGACLLGISCDHYRLQ